MVDKTLLDGEFRILESWAEDVKSSLGGEFAYKLLQRYQAAELMLICEFEVKTDSATDVVKSAIRKEAEKYRKGRLYFMAFDRRRDRMILQFYSFYLGGPKDLHSDEL